MRDGSASAQYATVISTRRSEMRKLRWHLLRFGKCDPWLPRWLVQGKLCSSFLRASGGTMKNEIRVSTWEECERELQRIEQANSGSRGVWFRGHASSQWLLQTTLERRTLRHDLVIGYLRLMSRIKTEIETFTEAAWDMPSQIEMETWCKTYE